MNKDLSTGYRQWIFAMVALASIVMRPFGVAAQTVDWSGLGDGTDWHDGDNWNPAGVPGTGTEVTVAAGATILLTTETAELASFTMTGGTLTFSNWTTRLRAIEVDLQGGTLTHPGQSATSTNAFGEWIPDARVWIACSNLTVAAGATIDVMGRGYDKFKGPGNTTGESLGGSYGGLGSISERGYTDERRTYGSVSQPEDPGTGGGGVSSTHSQSGGGAIRIDAEGEVLVYGTLNANGANATGTHGGGGSGGSILINCREFGGGGTGWLTVRGGNANNRGGAGGGGRIAVNYDPAVQAVRTPVNAGVRFRAAPGTSGPSAWSAEAGTLYLPDVAFLANETLTVQWDDVELHIPDFTEWSVNTLNISGKIGLPMVTNLVVTDDFTLGGTLRLYSVPTNALTPDYGVLLSVGGVLSVEDGGRLVLTSNPTNGASPRVECTDLLVAASGTIDADRRGFALETGPGRGSGGRGAGYGGIGSSGGNSRDADFGQPYGNPFEPTDLGSGGGHVRLGGYGGGAIRLHVTNNAAIHGTLTANGSNAIRTHGGGASGGSILLICETFSGSASGLLQARGGNGDNTGGAGAGGRIAVLYNSAAQAALPEPNPGVRFNVAPGTGGGNSWLAEAGTVYLPQAETIFLSETMTQWEGGNLVIPGFTHWETPALLVSGRFSIPSIETMRVTGDLVIADGGELTLQAHPTNIVDGEIGMRLNVGGTVTVEDGGQIVKISDYGSGSVVYIECGQLDLRAGGTIHSDYRGFDFGVGDGKGGHSRTGSGYGGRGSRGDRSDPELAGPTYGEAHAPLLPGSGTYDVTHGGRGGGAIRIGARGRMIVDGTLSVQGMTRIAIHSGGASGGGILLSAGRFEGAGLMQADAGNSSHSGGPGGGGRIAVWTPFMPPVYLRQFAKRNLPAHAIILDPEALYPYLDLSVATGTGGNNPDEAEEGTIFFGKFRFGSLITVR